MTRHTWVFIAFAVHLHGRSQHAVIIRGFLPHTLSLIASLCCTLKDSCLTNLQLEMACKYNKPILLHERDAYTDFMGIIVKYQSRLPPVVIHCFTGTREQALVYVAMGFYIGITGKPRASTQGIHLLLLNMPTDP